MPTIHRLANMTLRINTPDHRPPHVHVITTNRRDALVDLATLSVKSRHLKPSDIAPALAWVADNRDLALRLFEEYNP